MIQLKTPTNEPYSIYKEFNSSSSNYIIDLRPIIIITLILVIIVLISFYFIRKRKKRK